MPINANGAASYNISAVNTWRAAVSSNSGLPTMTIIAGYNHNNPPMPVGMELIGKMYGEQQLISMAYAYSINSKPLIEPKLGNIDNPTIMNITIPELNNLFTLIGYESYKKALQYGKPEDLTPKRFKKIVKDVIYGYPIHTSYCAKSQPSYQRSRSLFLSFSRDFNCFSVCLNVQIAENFR